MCHHKVTAARPFSPDPEARQQKRHAQDPLSIDGWDEEDYLDGYWDPA
jgi:hypothetical protein